MEEEELIFAKNRETREGTDKAIWENLQQTQNQLLLSLFCSCVSVPESFERKIKNDQRKSPDRLIRAFVQQLPIFAFTLSSAFNGLTSVFEMRTGISH